ncbi:NAD(P)-dependent oxidoreductase [Arthrobacter methylotrophus]|uniref:NAD(P)-dependent oxidoreductase n=1 Tax=Arthrobacter methylotrophus TaxID=121291 RepID=A0ABV5UJR6_9MICC
MPTRALAGKTIVMSGGSRGIGQAIALRAAADGANIVLIAKTTEPHPGLTGTIHTAAAAIEAAGGRALAFPGDIRSDTDIADAVEAAIETFGGIDICVNNASVLNLASTLELDPKRYDLMQDVNVRGTFQLSRACLPHLLKADNPHVLSLSPPLNLTPRWLGAHPAYTLAKFGMTIATLGVAAEFAGGGVAANCLWPRTLIATDAVSNLMGGTEAVPRARSPKIMADAAHAIFSSESWTRTGATLIDEDVLRVGGTVDFSIYSDPAHEGDLELDLFVD